MNMTLTLNKKLSEYGKKGAEIRWHDYNVKINNLLKKPNTFDDLILKARLCGFLAGDGTVAIRRENKKSSSNHYEVNFYPDHKSLVKS